MAHSSSYSRSSRAQRSYQRLIEYHSEEDLVAWKFPFNHDIRSPTFFGEVIRCAIPVGEVDKVEVYCERLQTLDTLTLGMISVVDTRWVPVFKVQG